MVTRKNVVKGQLPSVFHRKKKIPLSGSRERAAITDLRQTPEKVWRTVWKKKQQVKMTVLRSQMSKDKCFPGSSSFRLRQVTKLTPVQGNRSLGQDREGLGSPPCWLLRIALSSSKWATGEPENHNFKTDFIQESNLLWQFSRRGKQTTNPFPTPSPWQNEQLQHKAYWSQVQLQKSIWRSEILHNVQMWRSNFKAH